MAISKEIIRECIVDQQMMVSSAELIERAYSFEDNANYVLVGVRHVGKSYLLYQRIRHLFSQGYTWDEVLFLNFDDERLAEFSTEDLNSILEVHYTYSEKKPILFLDELQRIDHWEMFARRLVNEKYTVYITGSNAKMLSSEIATTLGGRFFILEVYPYSFEEFLRAQSISWSGDWIHSTRKKSEIKRAFLDYFYYGGLPEIISYQQKRQMLSSLYQKIYLGDIVARNKISEPRSLNILVKKIAESVCQPISFRRLNNIVVSTGSKISLPTTISYLEAICASWLAIPMKNQLAQLADRETIQKYYFIDNGLLNLFLLRGETILLENVVAVDLMRRYGKEAVSYYLAGQEIDFVVDDQRLAIQVCYNIDTDDTRDRELAPLARFAAAHPDWRCVVITNDTATTYSKQNISIQAIPAYQWLLRDY